MRTGSPRNAIFRGRHRSEYAWFSISDALPGLSISAENAARRIVAGCRRGDAEVLFPLPARVAAVVNAVAPGLTAGDASQPGGSAASRDRAGTGRTRKGAESQSWLSPSWLSRLGDRAARKYNQIATRRATATTLPAQAGVKESPWHRPTTECLERDAGKTCGAGRTADDGVNVGKTERLISGIAGAALMALALRREAAARLSCFRSAPA